MPKLFYKILIITSFLVVVQAMGSSPSLSTSSYQASSTDSSALSFLSSSVPVMASTTAVQGSNLPLSTSSVQMSNTATLATSFVSQSVPVTTSTNATQPSTLVTTTSDEKKESKESKEEKEEAKKQEKKKISTSALVQKEKDNETMTGDELNELGEVYYRGGGVTKDLKKAVVLFQRAAKLDDASAMYNLGNCLFFGVGVTKDETNAVALYQQAAAKGEARAMNNLGYCLQHGMGVEKDEKRAVELYRQAAGKGDALAMNNLGDCLQVGIGVMKDEKKAAEWYEKGATLGEARAMNNLGYCLQHGIGVEKSKENEQKAVTWYEKGAALGKAQAMNNLGYCLQHGIGVMKDEKRGFKLYQQAAELGAYAAMYNLGYCYENGRGCEVDHIEAVKWIIQAAEKGEESAQALLGKWLLLGSSVYGVDQKKAIDWFQKAAGQNDDDGLLWLGYCYKQGLGIKLDRTQAQKLFEKVAKLKSADEVKAWVSQQEQDRVGLMLNQQGGQIGLLNKTCSLCTREICTGQLVYRFNCAHGAHKICFDQYVTNHNPKKCPECEEIGNKLVLGNALVTTTSEEKKESREDKKESKDVKKDEKESSNQYIALLLKKEKDKETMTVEELNELGEAYLHGIEMEVDEKKAVELFQQAADKDYVLAMNNLGYCYENGIGYEVDHLEAATWIVQAAEKGEAAAQVLLGEWLLLGSSVYGVDQVKAVEWFQKAARQDNYNGLLWLGYCYQQGLGIEINITESKKLFDQAVALKSADEVETWVSQQDEAKVGLMLNQQGCQFSLFDTICPICTNEIQPGMLVYRFDCVHGGHKICFDQYLRNLGGNAQCCVCKKVSHRPVLGTLL